MQYKAGYKYILTDKELFQTSIFPPELIETPFVQLHTNGVLALAAGYAWDGSTMALDTRWCMRASAAHDAICQLIQIGLLSRQWKRQGDQEYYNLCCKDGMPLLMAINRFFWIQFHDWENSRPAKIFTAP